MTKPKKREPVKALRKFPFVCVGMNVLWYPDGRRNLTPMAAVVVAVGEMALDLHVIEAGYDNPIKKDGVRWMDEPDVGPQIRLESGGWEHTAFTNMIFGEHPEFSEWPDERGVKKPEDKGPATGTQAGTQTTS